MPYKVVIVDDEDIIREGLASLVDWEAIGFELVAQFEDGKEALQYIQSSPVDVVFTDIKMTVVSGIELAKYIYDNRLPIKVILVSGYKDFEYARQAVRFNVVEYIIKPISIKDIKEVFSKVKAELDDYKSMQEKELKNVEIVSIMKEQLINDLVLGALRNRDELENRIILLGSNINIDKNRCGLIEVCIKNYHQMLNERWKYGEEGIHTIVKNLIISDASSLFYYITYKESGRLQLLAIDSLESNENEFSEKLNKDMEVFKRNLEEVLETEICVQVGSLHDNLYNYALITSSHSSLLQTEGRYVQADNQNMYVNRAIDKQKLLISHINDGDYEAVKGIFEGFVEELRALDIKSAQKYTIDLFDLVLSKLKENEVNVYNTVTSLFSYKDINNLTNVEDIQHFGFIMLGKMTDLLQKNAELMQGSVIARAKQYIQAEYFNDVTLNQVADHVFLNPAYLSRLFKEQTGENFVDYLIQVRMKAAGELLKNPNFKIYEVGNMVGYNSTKYFFRLFKKVYGCTPNEYRQKVWQGENDNNYGKA